MNSRIWRPYYDEYEQKTSVRCIRLRSTAGIPLGLFDPFLTRILIGFVNFNVPKQFLRRRAVKKASSQFLHHPIRAGSMNSYNIGAQS